MIPSLMAMEKRNMLVKYLRGENRRPYGVVVAIERADNTVGIGFSAVKPGSNDVFNRERGLNIAIGRAETCDQLRDNRDALFAGLKNHNPEVYGAIYEMYHRAGSYFKDRVVLNP